MDKLWFHFEAQRAASVIEHLAGYQRPTLG